MRRRLMQNNIDSNWWKNYLTIEVLGDGLELRFLEVFGEDGVFKYNKNNTGWVGIRVDDNDYISETLTFNSGDIVALKALRSTSDLGYCRCFIEEAPFNLKGNALSVIYGDNANNYSVIPDSGFSSFFHGCSTLLNVSKDFLPVTEVERYGCYSMFAQCTSLVSAPDLPATTLTPNCYSSMFKDCSKLNYINAAFTTTPATAYTNNWVDGVASSGTFVKNKNATWDVRGVHGIPTGWTVITE